MTRLDASVIAEIGAWQDLPPRSTLRRVTMAIVALAEHWASRARQRRALSRLDDRLLRDIGVSPYDAAHEADKPFWR